MVRAFILKLINFKILLLIILILNIFLATAQPELPIEIYGTAKSFNVPVNIGTIIQAIDINGNKCGEFKVTNKGFFGILSCIGKNTSEEINGATTGEIIRFRIGNFPATVLLGNTTDSITNLIWESGKFKEINLVAPPLVCGDGFCDSYENCNTCPEDCGLCDEGSSGPVGPVAPIITPQFPDLGPLFPEPETLSPEEEIIECAESWVCNEWTACLPSGIQRRNCYDENECDTEENKPETERPCIYEESEIIQSNITERPRIETPMTLDKCDERLSLLGFESLMFFLIFIIIIIVPLFYLEYKKRKIKKKKLDKIDELLMLYKFENKVYIFLIIVSVLSIIVYLYHYFFFICEDVYYNNLWLLLGFILLSPIIINLLLYMLKYSERKKIVMMQLLSNTHYKHLKYLITIFNKDLLKSEVEITNKIYSLNNKDEFSDLLVKTKEIKKIYNDLLKLYSLYTSEKDSLKIEKDLLNQIESLDKNKDFNDAVKDYPELESLKNNISLLYQAYDSKKDLLNKLKEIEQEYDDELNNRVKKSDVERSDDDSFNDENKEHLIKEIDELNENERSTSETIKNESVNVNEKVKAFEEFSEDPDKTTK